MIGRIALSLVAISVHDLLVPISYSARPLFALGAFSILVVARCRSRVDLPSLPRLSAARVVQFVFLHLLLVATAYYFAANLGTAAKTFSLSASVVAAGKVLVVLPAFVLFPADRRFWNPFASELLAASIVLFTYFPDRHFQLIWPAYSKVLVTSITYICSFVVPGTHLAEAADGLVLVGPAVDMNIDFACSGIAGINLFHLVFGIVVAVEWNRIHRLRALLCYVCGSLVYLLANSLRLITLYVVGNLISPNINLDLFGWILFAVTFWAILRITYDWMVPPRYKEQNSTLAAMRTA